MLWGMESPSRVNKRLQHWFCFGGRMWSGHEATDLLPSTNHILSPDIALDGFGLIWVEHVQAAYFWNCLAPKCDCVCSHGQSEQL